LLLLIGLLFWSVRTGQFDDLERQGYNILLDDESPNDKKRDNTNTKDTE